MDMMRRHLAVDDSLFCEVKGGSFAINLGQDAW